MIALLKLFGLWKQIIAAINSLLEWLICDWRNCALAGLLAYLAVHILVLDPNLRNQISAMQSQRNQALGTLAIERKAHMQTISNYRRAALQAKLEARANVARVKVDQDAATKEITHDYETRLASLRARARSLRLHGQSSAASSGNIGGSNPIDLPGPANTARFIDETTRHSGLSTQSGSHICHTTLNIEQAEIASAQALQLNALIHWVEAQSAISNSGSHISNSQGEALEENHGRQ